MANTINYTGIIINIRKKMDSSEWKTDIKNSVISSSIIDSIKDEVINQLPNKNEK